MSDSPRASIRPLVRHCTAGPGAERILQTDQDLVAAEAPVRLTLRQQDRDDIELGVLMRTPGDDPDLVRGLLLTEGVIQSASHVLAIDMAAPSAELRAGPSADLLAGPERGPAHLIVTLDPGLDLSLSAVSRALATTSACGLCGRLGLEGLDALGHRAIGEGPHVSASLIAALPDGLRAGQRVFAETGGLHAAGLFDLAGRLITLREDVGRHNAVDKLIGARLADGGLPAVDAILVVSGRVAYEIVQKTAAAGCAVLVAVGAPTDLAIDAARAALITLVGFARDGRFNVYTGADRIEMSS